MSTTTTSKKRKVPAGNQAAAPKKPKAPTSASAPPPPQEKRAARYRSKPPEGVMARIHRAISQRLYLLDQRDTSGGGGTGISVGTSARPGQQMSRHYAVLGSTGNVYDVDICQKPCCTCPDYQRGHLCKHILFVFLKVLRVHPSSPHIYQKALLQIELEGIFANAPRQVKAAVSAKACVTQAYRKDVLGEEVVNMNEKKENKPKDAELPPLEGECAVCFDPMTIRAEATSCPTCNHHLHTDCLKQWLKHSHSCVYCRSPLVADEVKGKGRGSSRSTGSRTFEGYVNLGDMQGQSRSRDTSTYNDNSYSYRR